MEWNGMDLIYYGLVEGYIELNVRQLNSKGYQVRSP